MAKRENPPSNPYGLDLDPVRTSDGYLLAIIQRDDWDGSEEQQNDLVAKVGGYLHFIAEDSEQYVPASNGEDWTIELQTRQELPEALTRVWEQLTKTARERGVTLKLADRSR